MRNPEISSAERLTAFPDWPTFREQGYQDLVVLFWHGLFAPAGTPQPVIQRLHGVISAAVRGEAFMKLARPEQHIAPTSPEEFAARIARETESIGKLIRSRNIKISQ